MHVNKRVKRIQNRTQFQTKVKHLYKEISKAHILNENRLNIVVYGFLFWKKNLKSIYLEVKHW